MTKKLQLIALFVAATLVTGSAFAKQKQKPQSPAEGYKIHITAPHRH